jgi:hypothetical protein
MADTVTTQHVWVKHTITPVSTLPDEGGEPVVFVDPMQQDLAEQDAVYGCQVCGQPMAGNYNTNCPGSDEEAPDDGYPTEGMGS